MVRRTSWNLPVHIWQVPAAFSQSKYMQFWQTSLCVWPVGVNVSVCVDRPQCYQCAATVHW